MLEPIGAASPNRGDGNEWRENLTQRKKTRLRRLLIAAVLVTLHFCPTSWNPFLDHTLTYYGVHQQLVARNDDIDDSGPIRMTTKTSISAFTNTKFSSGPFGRIAFRLHEPGDATVNSPGKYDPIRSHLCQNTADLPPSIARKNVFGFKVSISTDLKLVFIGDSVAGQLSQAFDTSVLDLDYDYLTHSVKSHFHYKTKDEHICVAESAPIRGGGVSAFMRHNFMISSESFRSHGKCEHGAQFWGLDTVYSLLDHDYSNHQHNTDNIQSSRTKRVGEFDAAILKLSFGWIKDINSITKEKVIEEIKLVGKYFGVETIIISTIAFNNNVLTLDTWHAVHRVNALLREIASTWMPPALNSEGIHWVLVQEFAEFTNQLIWTNAKHLGYNLPNDFSTHDWAIQNDAFLLDRLQNYTFWAPNISMVCGERSKDNTTCVRNKISPDGGHWCTATIGPRYSASIACLLGCVYNVDGFDLVTGISATGSATDRSVHACEQECNRQFMSLTPVDKMWIEGGFTLYAQAR